MLLDKCWADGQPPLPPCKVVWYQGCLRLGASSVPTQESVNAQGVWVLESCGTKPAHSSTILGDDQSVIRTTNFPERLSSVTSTQMSGPGYLSSLSLSLSVLFCSPAQFSFFPGFFIHFGLLVSVFCQDTFNQMSGDPFLILVHFFLKLSLFKV